MKTRSLRFFLLIIWAVITGLMGIALPFIAFKLIAYPLRRDYLWQLIQEYRVEHGLPQFKENKDACLLVQKRIEMNKEFYDAHEGFTTEFIEKTIDGTKYTMGDEIMIHVGIVPYPFQEKSALDWWLHSPPHKAALNDNYPYACLATSGNIAIVNFLK